MVGYPKPSRPPEKPRQPIPRGKPPERTARMPKRAKRPKFGNAYTRPEWREKVREIDKRSGGVCEMQTHCGGAPAEGDPEHLGYDRRYSNWKRLMVPNERLRAGCRRCRVAFEKRRAEIGEEAAEAEYLAWELTRD